MRGCGSDFDKSGNGKKTASRQFFFSALPLRFYLLKVCREIATVKIVVPDTECNGCG